MGNFLREMACFHVKIDRNTHVYYGISVDIFSTAKMDPFNHKISRYFFISNLFELFFHIELIKFTKN